MSYRVSFASLLMLFFTVGLVIPVNAQFRDEDAEPGFSDDDAPSDRNQRRDERRDRENGRERGDRGDRGDRGLRGPRSNPLFDALDVDGDGMISARELRQAVRNLKELDADGDGNISLEEVSPRRGPGGPGGFGDPNAMLDRWMDNDANGDGVLTQDEVPEFMARMLTGADTNGDQAFDRDELQQAMQNFRDNFGRGGGGGFGGFGGRGFGPGGGGDPDSMTRQFIGQADQNGDGTISADEMNPQMRQTMRGADTDGNGVLDAREIRTYMETARQRMQQMRGQFGRQNGRNGFDPRADRRARDQGQD